MIFPEVLKKSVEKELSSLFNTETIIKDSEIVGGGCIHNSSRLITNNGIFFIKWNTTPSSFHNFTVEAKGLQLLSSTNTISTPKVICVAKVKNYSYLILEFINSIGKKEDFWENFGHSLAKLHKNTNNKFGLDFDNYIGSLTQVNNFNDDWVEFFIIERLEKQIRLAEKNNLMDVSTKKSFEHLYSKLNQIFPDEKPSLIHGDLWSGNFTIGSNGYVVILDPAVYYANREAEIAFTQLFGGFNSKFYQAYNEEFPMMSNWQERMDVYNLYPLLVHLNLFGMSYMGQIRTILTKY